MGGFTQWLQQFRQVNSAIGDLARDVARDPGWPEDGDLDVYREHLQDVAGLDDDAPAMLALESAWETWLQQS